jgi:hypothetical protein
MAFGSATKGYVRAHSSGGGGGGTSDYTKLTNKPSINGVVLTGNKTSEDLNIGGSVDVIHFVGDDTRSRVHEVGEYSALKVFGILNNGYTESSWADGVHTYYWADSNNSKTGNIIYGNGTIAFNSQNSGLEFNALNVDYYIIIIR